MPGPLGRLSAHKGTWCRGEAGAAPEEWTQHYRDKFLGREPRAPEMEALMLHHLRSGRSFRFHHGSWVAGGSLVGRPGRSYVDIVEMRRAVATI